MKIFNILLLAATAAAAALPQTNKGDFDSLVWHLQKLDADTQKLAGTAAAYDGDIWSAMAIKGTSTTLSDDIKEATGYVNNQSDALSAENAAYVLQFFREKLEKSVQAAAQQLVNKRNLVGKGGFLGQVRGAVLELRGDVAGYGQALVAKGVDATVTQGIDGLFAQLVQIYSIKFE